MLPSTRTLRLLLALIVFEVATPIQAGDPPFLLPDLKAWNAVQKGMTVEDLEKLLGKPLKKNGPNGAFEPNALYNWTYGYVAKKSAVFPRDATLFIWVSMGKVWSREDPFGGVPVSETGSPTIPRLMTPGDGTLYEHYPRYVDFRWYASSGDYPMKYEIQVDTQNSSGEWKIGKDLLRADIPYCSYVHSGASPGRWRVRAVNAKGKSDWSEYFTFDFAQ